MISKWSIHMPVLMSRREVKEGVVDGVIEEGVVVDEVAEREVVVVVAGEEVNVEQKSMRLCLKGGSIHTLVWICRGLKGERGVLCMFAVATKAVAGNSQSLFSFFLLILPHFLCKF